MADNRIYWPSRPILPVGERSVNRAEVIGKQSPAFADLLKSQSGKQVSFSQHALQRLRDRQINLGEQELAKLDDTVERMADKGARESLIYMNDIALIVSVANRTVITAMDGPSAKENIFTNIDSAAIL
ncbi:MAG: flagellar protein [Schwartzia sp.]|nr:flagellar protein [Schwartzia sp. (in: firmicutes)]